MTTELHKLLPYDSLEFLGALYWEVRTNGGDSEGVFWNWDWLVEDIASDRTPMEIIQPLLDAGLVTSYQLKGDDDEPGITIVKEDQPLVKEVLDKTLVGRMHTPFLQHYVKFMQDLLDESLMRMPLARLVEYSGTYGDITPIVVVLADRDIIGMFFERGTIEVVYYDATRADRAREILTWLTTKIHQITPTVTAGVEDGNS